MKRLLLFAIILTPLPIGTTLLAQGGSRDNCHTTNGSCNDVHAAVVRTNGDDISITFTGGMKLRCIDTGTTTSGNWWWKQNVDVFDGAGTDSTLGAIILWLDSSRTPASWMETSTPGVSWPRIHHVYAHAKLTMSSTPGIIYRSKNPFHMYNYAITSFALPGSPQTYDVADDVEFESEANPGPVMMTVLKSPTTVYP